MAAFAKRWRRSEGQRVRGLDSIQELIFRYHATRQSGSPCALHHSLRSPSTASWSAGSCRHARQQRWDRSRSLADPGKYQFYNCEQLAGQRTYWTNRELELKLLMDKADQGTGGAVVNVIAYQADYVTAREELKVIDATARAKNCDAPRRP
jgi:hypothetical protein